MPQLTPSTQHQQRHPQQPTNLGSPLLTTRATHPQRIEYRRPKAHRHKASKLCRAELRTYTHTYTHLMHTYTVPHRHTRYFHKHVHTLMYTRACSATCCVVRCGCHRHALSELSDTPTNNSTSSPDRSPGQIKSPQGVVTDTHNWYCSRVSRGAGHSTAQALFQCP